jgi:hypothetical protein
VDKIKMAKTFCRRVDLSKAESASRSVHWHGLGLDFIRKKQVK